MHIKLLDVVSQVIDALFQFLFSFFLYASVRIVSTVFKFLYMYFYSSVSDLLNIFNKILSFHIIFFSSRNFIYFFIYGFHFFPRCVHVVFKSLNIFVRAVLKFLSLNPIIYVSSGTGSIDFYFGYRLAFPPLNIYLIIVD